MGEYIRIQFQVPSSKEMACHSRVVRIEKLQEDSFLVGVEFEALNSSQKWNLTRGLKKKTTEENQSVVDLGQRMRNAPPWILLLFYASVGFSLFFSAFLLAAVFKFLSDPLGMDRIIWLFQAVWRSL
jgi:hypothetical protein